MAQVIELSDDDDIEIIEEDTEVREAIHMSWETHTDRGIRQIMENTVSYEETRHNYSEFKRKSYRDSSVEFDLLEGEHESDFYCYLCTRFPFNPKICTNCRRIQCNHCYLRLKDIYPVPKCQNDRNNPCIIQDVDETRKNRMNMAKITCNFGCGIILEYADADLHHVRGNCPNGICRGCGLYKYSNKRHNGSDDCTRELIKFSTFVDANHRMELIKRELEIESLRRQLTHPTLEQEQNLFEANRRLSERPLAERRLFYERQRRSRRAEMELSHANARLEQIQQQNSELRDQLQALQQRTIGTNPTDGETDFNRNEPRVVHINSLEFGTTTLNQRIYRTSTTWDRLIEMALTQYNFNTEEAIRRTADYALYDVRTHIRSGPEIVGGFLRQNHVLNLVRRDFLNSGTPYMLNIQSNPTTFPSTSTPNNATDTTTRSSGLPRGSNSMTSNTRISNNPPRNHENRNSRIPGNRRIRQRVHPRQQQYALQHRRYNQEHRY